jgi:hypothetical protein
VLRRIFDSKKEEVAGGWRRLHNEELRNLYASPNIIRDIRSRRKRWAEHVECVRDEKYNILIGKPKGKRPLRRPRFRWEDNISMDVREVGWDG